MKIKNCLRFDKNNTFKKKHVISVTYINLPQYGGVFDVCKSAGKHKKTLFFSFSTTFPWIPRFVTYFAVSCLGQKLYYINIYFVFYDESCSLLNQHTMKYRIFYYEKNTKNYNNLKFIYQPAIFIIIIKKRCYTLIILKYKLKIISVLHTTNRIKTNICLVIMYFFYQKTKK